MKTNLDNSQDSRGNNRGLVRIRVWVRVSICIRLGVIVRVSAPVRRSVNRAPTVLVLV